MDSNYRDSMVSEQTDASLVDAPAQVIHRSRAVLRAPRRKVEVFMGDYEIGPSLPRMLDCIETRHPAHLYAGYLLLAVAKENAFVASQSAKRFDE